MARAIATPNEAEDARRCRKFALSDAMLLIVGMAVALTGPPIFFLPAEHLLEWLPVVWHETVARIPFLSEHWPTFSTAVRSPTHMGLWFACKVLQLALFAMTLPILVIRLRRPRPALNELLRQPGMVASLAIVIGAFWVQGYLDLFFFFFKCHTDLTPPTAVGGTVAVAWAILALSRRWQSEPGWIDRLGRWLGYAAICAALLGLLTYRH